MKRQAVNVFLMVVLVAASGCATVSTDLVTGKRRGFGYTWAQQVQLGREADPQIVSQFGAYTHEELDAYVDRIGQRILEVSHLRRPEAPAEVQNTPFTFRVLDSPVVNAFALPGGYIYVTRGLLSHLENEAQLAVVLGHEIAHIARQHSARQAFEAQRAQGLLVLGAIVGQGVLGGNAAETILGYGSQAAQLLLMSYGRDDERESDNLGVEYAALAGYEAAEGASFFTTLRRLSERSGSTLPSFLSTHPDPGEREQTIRQLAQEWETRADMTLVRQQEYYSQIDGIVFGENPRQGFVENGVFYHPDLRFRLNVPQGFQVQNEASQVLMGEPNGQVILGLRLAPGSSAADAARQAASQQGLQLLDSGTTTVNGNRAAYILADAASQNQVVRLLNFYVEYEGRVYSLLSMAAQQNFARYQPLIEQTFGSFRALTDQRLLSVQPVRLETLRASRTAPFQSFLPRNMPGRVTAEDLAIANQISLDAQIGEGALVKIVEQ